jgi:hypothetical protein
MVAPTIVAPERSNIHFTDARGIVRQTDPSRHYTADQLRRKLDEVKSIVWPKWLAENGNDPARLCGLRYEFPELGIFIDDNGEWRRADPEFLKRKLRNADEEEYTPHLNYADLAFGQTSKDIYQRLLKAAHLWRPCIDEELMDAPTLIPFGTHLRLIPRVKEESDVALAG